MNHILTTALVLTAAFFCPNANGRETTSYPTIDCRGTSKPYPHPRETADTPDSLTAVMINHVGRHGARYPANPTKTMTLKSALDKASNEKTITPTGKKLSKLVDTILELSSGRWGILDSLGIAEQQAIASRMFLRYPDLFRNGHIKAISSYVPRCVQSMYEFLYQIARYDSNVEIDAASGRSNSRLLRFFEINKEYIDLRKSGKLDQPYKEEFDVTVTYEPLKRVLGENFPMETIDKESVIMAMYSVVSSTAAMELPSDPLNFFTLEEYNRLWSLFNLKQYLYRSANTVSTTPADIAAPLLENLIATTDSLISGNEIAPVQLRFGHAETILPLLALMHAEGAYYLTNYYDTVARHWHDFYISPMAANLQLILFKSNRGKYYVRMELNENVVPLIPGKDEVYVPWEKARNFLIRCLPSDYMR